MKIAIVVPRYGEEIVGGAETLARTLAEFVVQQGWQVTVLTTCAYDHHSWENHFSTGKTTLNQVEVLRFPVSYQDATTYHQLNHQLSQQFSLTRAEQFRWLKSGPHSPQLYACLQANLAEFDVIFALPYLSTIVQYAAWVAPQKTVLLPCLHKELYVFMEPVRLLLATVRAVLFLSPEEQAFAVEGMSLGLENTAVIGMGLDNPPEPLPGITPPDTPYLLLVSRLEPAKNLAILYEYVQRYVEEGNALQLQILGTGSFAPPDHPAFQLRGFLPHAEKLAWAQSALATCQPSLMESFSIVIMESWQMGRPVLVHKRCAVTSGHVQRSSGGFTFATYKEFANAVDWLQTHPTEAQQMGKRGQAYVDAHYRWPIIFEKLVDLLSRSGFPISGI